MYALKTRHNTNRFSNNSLNYPAGIKFRGRFYNNKSIIPHPAIYGGNFWNFLRNTASRLFRRISPSIDKALTHVPKAIENDQQSKDSLKQIGREALREVGDEAQKLLVDTGKSLLGRLTERLSNRLRAGAATTYTGDINPYKSNYKDNLQKSTVATPITKPISHHPHLSNIEMLRNQMNILEAEAFGGRNYYQDNYDERQKGSGIGYSLSSVNRRDYTNKTISSTKPRKGITTKKPHGTKTKNEKIQKITKANKHGGLNKKSKSDFVKSSRALQFI